MKVYLLKFLRIVSALLSSCSPHRFIQQNVKRLLLLLLAGVVLLYTAGPAAEPLSAAIELIEAFTVTVTDASIKMNWSTASEYGVSHFEILCKGVDEPEAAYHVIQTIDAVGAVDKESAYEFILTTGLEQGKSYCFRLDEVTSNDDPGDSFERCGYGFNITPTPGLAPTLTPIPTFTPTFTPTVTAVSVSPLESPLDARNGEGQTDPNAPATQTPTETPTQTPTQTPTETSTQTPAVTATATIEPTATFTPSPTETATMTPATAITATATLTATATPTGTASVTTTLTPTATGLLDTGPADLTPTDDGSGAAIPNFDELAAQVDPNAPYIVVTYTPSPEPLQLALVYTPIPTAPAATLSLARFLTPTTENIVVMLLCLTFFSASGLGIMGLLTSALYLRSRDSRRRDR